MRFTTRARMAERLSSRGALAILALGAVGLAAVAPLSSAWSQVKEPPSCAAISFRPLADGASDGEQDAGLYKSRFGRILVKGVVKGGKVETYFVTVNNARPTTAALPASTAACAAAKKLPAPGKTVDVCLGERFQVLIDHAGDKRYVLLYARNAGTWQLCSAGAA